MTEAVIDSIQARRDRQAGAGPSLPDPRALPGSEDQWAAMGSPGDSRRFLAAWLALLAQQLHGASAAALLLRRPDGAFAPAALWPVELHDFARFTGAAQRAIEQRDLTLSVDESTGATVLAAPSRDEQGVSAVVLIEFATHPGPRLVDFIRRIVWASGWLDALAISHGEAEAREALSRSADSLQAIAALGEEARFDGALMAFCNTLAQRFNADRVALGLTRGNRVRVRAQANAAWFHRSTDLTRALELAMTEALFQRRSIVVPRPESAATSVTLAHEHLGRAFNARHLFSTCLLDGKRAVGVITLERIGAVPFEAAEIQGLELAAALAGPIIALKQAQNRWFAGRIHDGTGRFLTRLVGRRHPTVKLATLAVLVITGALAFLEGEFRIAAPAVIEGSVQRAAVAPFQGYIAAAPIRAGMTVSEGQLLARLDDRDLLLERLKWESEKQKSVQRQREALARSERSAMLVAMAQIAQSEAELALLDEKLARTEIRAPIAGLVVSGDLSQLLGTPVEQGKVLFEITPLDGYRVIIKVADIDVQHIKAGQNGELVLAGRTQESHALTLSTLTSVSTPADGRNAFRAEALLNQPATQLRPGMEGVAKLSAGRARLLWIWTRSTLERARLALWSWLP
jgi:multidrug efflux pump subunit AcrA (membrane-fusion protein)